MATKITGMDTTAAVDAFMASLDHPRKDGIEALRQLILTADPAIAEGIKWKSPSFRTHEYFATVNLRSAGIGLILHLGAKLRALPEGGLTIADPSALLKWLAKDRAMVEFADAAALHAAAPALRRLLQAWVAYV